MALMSTLVDAFATNDLAALWGGGYGTVTWSSGSVAVQNDSGYSSALGSSGTYTLTASSFYAKVTPYISSGAQTYIQLTASSGNDVSLTYVNGNLQAAITQGGTYTYLGGVTYNATSMAWWRIREASGTIFFDTSPDGSTWSNQFSTTYTMSLASMSAWLYAGGASATGSSHVTNVNTTGTGGGPVTSTGSVKLAAPGVTTGGIPTGGLVYMGGFTSGGGNAYAADWAIAQGLPNANGGFQLTYNWGTGWTGGSNSVESVQVSLAQGMAAYPGPCCLSVAMTQSDTETDLSSALSGSSLTSGCFTAHQATAVACLENGVQFIRMAWEFNGGANYNWMPPFSSYTAAEFVTLWKLIYNVYSSAAVAAGKPANWFKFVYTLVQNDSNGVADLVNYFPGMPYAAYLTIDEYDRTGGGYTGWAEALNDPPTVTQMVSYALAQGCEGVGMPEWGIRNDAYAPSVIPDPAYVTSSMAWAKAAAEQGLNVLMWPWGNGYSGSVSGIPADDWNFAAWPTMWSALTGAVATGISQGWIATANPTDATAVSCSGSVAMAAPKPSGAAAQSGVSSSGSVRAASLGVSGSEAETITSSGSARAASLGVSGTASSAVTGVTSSGSARAAAPGVTGLVNSATTVAPSSFIGTLPGVVGLSTSESGPLDGRMGAPLTVQAGMPAAALPAGYPGGPAGAGSTLSSSPGSGWEVYVRAAGDYTTLLAVIPPTMLMNFQFAKQLDDIGSGTVTLSQDDPWWRLVTLPGGLPSDTLLNEECLWQVYQDGVCRFEFLGETITEQLVDPSEQRIVTVTGPGTIAVLKWAMVAPQGFPDIVLKLDGIQDAFDEVNDAGQGVLDTNIWTTASPSSHIGITPVQGLYNYPGGAGYALSTLYPSGSLTITASPGTTFLGASPYDATDTLVSAQVTPIGVSATDTDAVTPAKYGTGLNGSELTQFYIESNLNTSYYALFGLSASAFYCQFRGPSGTYTKILPAYDSGTHAYWQITEQGGTGGGSGTFYFWTSPDAQTWTLQWTIVHNWNATDVSLYVSAYYSVDNAQSAQLTNLNSNVTTPSYQGSIYLGVPMMGVWLDQFSAAQARGTIPFVASGITAAADTYGRPWTDSQNVQATNGTDMYSLLQSATSVVNADYVMQPGFQLVVGQPATGEVALGVDRSAYLILREGLDCAAKQRIRARNQITTSVGGENSDGHEISASSPTYIAQWGQREGWYQTAVQVDPTSMAYATAAALAQNETEVTSWTLTVTPNITGKTVFKNYDVGDWIGLEEPDFAAVDDVRVTGIAVQVDQSGSETHELTLISYIQWLAEQLTYISNRLGGQFVNTIGTSPVAPSRYGTGQVPTYFDPAATLAGLTDVASASASSVASAAPLVYNAATGNYQVAGTTDPVSGVILPTVVSGGNGATTTTGTQPDGTTTTVDRGGAAPAMPDTAVVAGIIQGVTVTWDGQLASAPPLLDFQYVEVYLGTSAAFAPGPATLMGTLAAAGTVTVGGLTAGVTYWAKLVAVNTSGNSSASSTAAPGTATGVPGGIITGQIPASLLGNSAGSWALNPNPFFNGGSLTGWTSASASLSATAAGPPGAPGAPAYVAELTATSPGGLMSGSPAPFPVTAGQPYAMTAWAYNPGGSPVSVEIGFGWSGGLQLFTVPSGVWTPLVTVQVAPAGGTAYQVIELPAGGTSVYVSGAVAAGQVSGQLIEAESITADQIAAGIILAGIVNGTTIEGAQFIAYGATGEVLIYSGPPTVGNLAGSWSAQAGNDAAIAGGAGNDYPAGLMVGSPGSSLVTLVANSSQPFNVTTAIAGVLTAMAQFTSGDTSETFPGLVGALNLGAGTTAKQTLVATSPFASTTGAAMMLESENDGGTDLAVVTFGTITSPDGDTLVFTPLLTLTPYAMIMYSGAGAQVVVTKTSGSGSIPIPAGVTVGKGETWGGGGGSGGGGSGAGGGGAGGAEYACEPSLALTSGGTSAYAVGAGGAAAGSGGAGGAGGSSTLAGSSVTVTAHGGSGGAGNGGAGGAGGTGSSNTIAEHGGSGGRSPSSGFGGGGGGGSGGPGGPGNNGSNSASSVGGSGGPAVPSGGYGGLGGTAGGSNGWAGGAPGGGAGGAGGGGPIVGHAGPAGQVRLTYVTITPAVGFSVNYGSSFTDQYGTTIPAGMNLGFTGTSIAVTSGTGMAGRIPLVQTNNTPHTVTAQTSFTQLSNAWPVPASDAQAGTVYRLTAAGSGAWGSTGETLILGIEALGVNPATNGTFSLNIGALEFPVSTSFVWRLQADVYVAATGTGSASLAVGMSATIGVAGSVNQLSNNNTVNATGGFASYTSVGTGTTTSAETIELQAHQGGGFGSIVCNYSILERLGP